MAVDRGGKLWGVATAVLPVQSSSSSSFAGTFLHLLSSTARFQHLKATLVVLAAANRAVVVIVVVALRWKVQKNWIVVVAAAAVVVVGRSTAK